jgi:hypothetical protein
MYYIQGGQPVGIDKRYLGCSDKTPPRDDKTITIHNELYFSKSSKIWENGGVAFIKSEISDRANTLGRMYLITAQQFVQVVSQENAREPGDDTIVIDFKKTIDDGQSMIDGGWYRRILYLGSETGHPIFTFTGGWEDDVIEMNAPGEKYMKVIIGGLKETYGMGDEKIIQYFLNVHGIKDLIEEEKLYDWINSI